MKTLRIMLDFLEGPIWRSKFNPETGEHYTGIPVVDNDKTVQKLNEMIQDIYSSYYEFNSHNQACWFNEEQEKADKEKMIGLIAELKDRLEIINDGTYVIEDMETPRLKQL